MNNKIVSIKRTSAIFLAIILVAGTIALSYPSFMIGSAQATSDREKDNNDDDKKSYDKDRDRKDKSREHDKDKTNKYDDESKDSSVIVNKIKCINTNLNINGNNAGNVSIDNKGQGYLGAYSSASGGYGGGEGYSKQDKGFDCIINNNNNNTNINFGGNQTIPSEPLTCEECFNRHLTPQQIDELLPIQGSRLTIETITQICSFLLLGNIATEAANLEALISDKTSATQEQIDALIDCLRDSGVFDPQPPINNR